MCRASLDPAGAAAARGVRGVERLDHDALVAVGERVAEERRGLRCRAAHQPRHPEPLRHDPGQRGEPFLARPVDQVLAVQVDDVEHERGQAGVPLPGAPGGPGCRHLKRMRPPILAQRDHLAVQHRVAHRQPGQGAGDLRQPVGDLVERAGEQAHGPIADVRLDPDTVHLPLHRRRADPGQGVLDRRSAGGEHRPDRPPDLQAELPEPRAALSQSGLRDRPHGSGQHQGPAHRGAGNLGGARDRLGHRTFQRTLMQLARQQPEQERLLMYGRPAEERVHQLLAGRHRALAGSVPIAVNAASTSVSISVGISAGGAPPGAWPSPPRSGAAAVPRTGKPPQS